MWTKGRSTVILNHESEEGISVWDVAFRDECPVEKGLVIQLLRLPCDELLGIVRGRRRCARTQTYYFLLFRTIFFKAMEE